MKHLCDPIEILIVLVLFALLLLRRKRTPSPPPNVEYFSQRSSEEPDGDGPWVRDVVICVLFFGTLIFILLYF